MSIGFVGTLSGRYSQLGVSSRDGLLLAVDEVNQNGGVNGRQVEVLVRNDQGEPDLCAQHILELNSLGVNAVIGPLTSNMAPAIREGLAAGAFIISPTVSTTDLSGLDDLFIRFIPDTSTQGHGAAGLIGQDGMDRVQVIYDSSNAQYTKEVLDSFRDEFHDEEHDILGEHGFQGANKPELESAVQEALAGNPDAIYLIASGTDAALIAQIIRNFGFSGALYGSQWSQTKELITHGGRSVEGLKSVGYDYPNPDSSDLARFTDIYRTRFFVDPDFAAISSYEAGMTLLQIIDRVGSEDPYRIKDALVDRVYPGVRGNFFIDTYGDTHRDKGYSVIVNGKFEYHRYEGP